MLLVMGSVAVGGPLQCEWGRGEAGRSLVK